MKKIKYEKPTSLDAGKVAAIQGANCSNGTAADDLCRNGVDPDIIPYCNATGTTATGNCWAAGGTAGQACYNTGGTPAPGTCIAGNSQ